MKRRRFLKLSFASVTAFLVQGCGQLVGLVGFTNTSDPGGSNNHTHTFRFTPEDLNATSANGINTQTSTDSATGLHAHTVSLTLAEVERIKSGETVTYTTPIDGTGHQHGFSFLSP